MFTNTKVKNFKSLKNIEIELKNLNILAGLNGMGKSSLIQSFLLLRQSYLKGEFSKYGLVLKGDYLELGTGKDIFYQGAGEEETIDLSFEYNGEQLTWHFSYSAEKQVLPLQSEQVPENIMLSEISLFNNNFQYLNAEHISPQSLHKKSQLDVIENRQLGIYGEFAVHYLIAFGDKEKVEYKNLIHPNAKSEYLIDNVDAWMNEISPGVRLRTEDLISVDQTKLAFEFTTLNGYTNEFKPINVGFGINHILPVLVSILSSRAGKLLLIENPEAHIHPKGQAVMGQLMFKAALNDIQLIVETHSDHVVNGIRVEAYRAQIGSNRVGFFFFERNKESDEHFSVISIPKLDANGRIDFWPDNFFDQWEKTLIELV